MTARELIDEVRAHGAELVREGDRLIIRGTGARLPDGLRQELVQHKAELLIAVGLPPRRFVLINFTGSSPGQGCDPEHEKRVSIAAKYRASEVALRAGPCFSCGSIIEVGQPFAWGAGRGQRVCWQCVLDEARDRIYR
jgi:hypothetical protein